MPETGNYHNSGALQRFMKVWEPTHALKLTPLQRVLLVTDGNLTAALEAAFAEPIQVRKLTQREIVLDQHATIGEAGQVGLSRRVLLVGVCSRRVYAHATSLIALDQLPALFKEALLTSDVPIGRLWVTYRMELYKEFLELSYPPAEELAQHLSCSRKDVVIRRQYRVYSTGRPIMLITEHLPIQIAVSE